jgi:heme exporter protein B
MNSSLRESWSEEIAAVLRKEMVSEIRQKSGLLTACLFAIVAVVAVAYSSVGHKLTSGFASGLIWVTLLFSSVVAIPRVFLLEEEQGTGDMLRLSARPHSVFWGKALFSLAQLALGGLITSILFFGLTGVPLYSAGTYAVGLLGGCAALAGAVTLCGALVSQAANRAVLAGAVALPLLLPLIALGVAATRTALEPSGAKGGLEAILGLWSYAVAAWALGPHLFAAVWRR